MFLSKDTKAFLENEIFPKMKIQNLTEKNSSIIVDFITTHYEIPLSQAEEAGDIHQSQMLKIASNAVTELTKNW